MTGAEPARSFSVKLVEVAGMKPVRPTRYSVCIISDDDALAAITVTMEIMRKTWQRPQCASVHYKATLAPILAFVRWQWAIARRTEYKWASGCFTLYVPI